MIPATAGTSPSKNIFHVILSFSISVVHFSITTYKIT